MKASEAKFLDFLKKSPQFEIPIYQRTYSWTEKECRQLWDDILRCGNNEEIQVHFVGSIVYVESGLSQVTHLSPLLVIDGQQRLTTVTLLLAALAEVAGEDELFDGFTARKIRNYYLLNPEEDGERYFKLLLSQTDKETLKAVVGCKELPNEHSIRIKENHSLFKEWLEKPNTDLKTICRGLAKLVVVDIALNRDQDKPQLIFESMNSTGKELSQADLIRNFILMGLEPKLQTRLYEEYWRPMELDFGQEGYAAYFDGFIRNFLTIRTGEIPRIGEVYEGFKAFARSSQNPETSEVEKVEALVRDVREASKNFCALALGHETEPSLKRAFKDLRELKVDVAYPLLLELYEVYQGGLLRAEEFEHAIRMVESYVFRRAVCEIPTNSMNKTFANFMKSVDRERLVESIKAQFLLLPSYRKFPKDEEFHRRLQDRDLYNFRSRSYWLRRFENYDRKEPVAVDEYTIEHILPQNENLNAQWREDLGEDWQEIQEKWLHTLGNLTLTGYNSEYSDHGFAQKRGMAGGFAESPLKLNKGLGQVEKWNEEAIKERAGQLASEALKVWTAPELNEDTLEEYRPKKVNDVSGSYTREDHEHLNNQHVGELFDAFRKEVLALDPCVTETFLKLYVAYKAETNFVDVVPQAKRLKLTLNMYFADIQDPKGICEDVTNMGRWGNGDIVVALNNMDELPYVMGLVRQSLERQLGDAE
jgi:uncharacterized protein with ParB-like and HNH nuclease domain/predicted transport protein